MTTKADDLLIESCPLHTEAPRFEAQAPAQIEAALKRGAHVIGFTEFSPAHTDLLAKVRPMFQKYGYVFYNDGTDAALAYKASLPDAKTGTKHIAGRRSRAHVSFTFHGRTVTVFTDHFEVLHFKDAAAVRATQAETLIADMAAASAGGNLSFFTADSNPSKPLRDPSGEPQHSLTKGGVVLIWDEAGFPKTTVGVTTIGRNKADTAAKAASVRLYPALGSDHRPALARYTIKRKETPMPATPPLAADYSFARPGPATIKAVGYKGVMRYLSHDPAKNVTKDEAQAILDQGLWLGLVWETVADRAAQGRAAGAIDAKAANDQADALGYPKDAVIFYAVDFDATPAQVEPYFAGAESLGRRPVGLYGGVKLTEPKIAPYNWQTVAWSSGVVDSHAHLYQRLKTTLHGAPKGIDENVVLNPFPAWGVETPSHHHSYPRIVRALKSNAQHTQDLRNVRAPGARIAVRFALAALAHERKRLARIVKRG